MVPYTGNDMLHDILGAQAPGIRGFRRWSRFTARHCAPMLGMAVPGARGVGRWTDRILERDEDWGWCYVDEIMMEPAPRARSSPR